MGKKQGIILIVVIAVSIVAVVGALVGSGIYRTNNGGNSSIEQGEEKKDGTVQTQETESQGDKNADLDVKIDGQKATVNGDNAALENKTPEFLYFVSESDANYQEALKVFDELKAEYGDKVNFELKNVTQDPELLERFQPVQGNTPFLIIDGNGDMSMAPKSADKKELEAAIIKILK